MKTIIKNLFEKIIDMFETCSDTTNPKSLVDPNFTDPSLAYLNTYDFNYEIGCPGFVPWF